MREYYSVVHDDVSTKGLLNILDNTKATEIIILSELEWELSGLTPDVIQQYKDKNVNLIVVLGSPDINYHTTVIHWDTFWINWTLENIRYVKVPELDTSKFTHPFISLNNRSHYHRCVFIDEMAKQNLIDKGIVTWVKHLNENPNYPYKHYDNRQRLLDDNFNIKLDSFLLPVEYHTSLFHIVVEATTKSNIISEKTLIPTFLKKPYLSLAGKSFNSELLRMGFKLYDEVFDYSFDDEEDIFKRTELYVSNVHKTLNLNLAETYNLLLPKILHNYNRAIEITRDKTLIPDIIKLCVSENDITDSVYGRYYRFLND